MVEVAASILNISATNTIQTLYNLEAAGIQYFHIDVMDGKFVKENTTERMTKYCEYLNSVSNLPLDVHLMVEDVESYITNFLVFEPNTITFHIEVAKNKEQIIEWMEQVKQNHTKVGIAIKPNTAIETIKELLPYLHQVTIMTVEPGAGGQAIIEETIQKIQKLAQYRDQSGLDFDIEADGGIKPENAKQLKTAGADILVSGTGILQSENFQQAVKELKK
ncbi:MAG: ribulose-phosphate 3-epimerase [Clostridia bacterium]|nr:ribulose-phosphate 3-epimerase [Clostridia bacterium]